MLRYLRSSLRCTVYPESDILDADHLNVLIVMLNAKEMLEGKVPLGKVSRRG